MDKSDEAAVAALETLDQAALQAAVAEARAALRDGRVTPHEAVKADSVIRRAQLQDRLPSPPARRTGNG